MRGTRGGEQAGRKPKQAGGTQPKQQRPKERDETARERNLTGMLKEMRLRLQRLSNFRRELQQIPVPLSSAASPPRAERGHRPLVTRETNERGDMPRVSPQRAPRARSQDSLLQPSPSPERFHRITVFSSSQGSLYSNLQRAVERSARDHASGRYQRHSGGRTRDREIDLQVSGYGVRGSPPPPVSSSALGPRADALRLSEESVGQVSRERERREKRRRGTRETNENRAVNASLTPSPPPRGRTRLTSPRSPRLLSVRRAEGRRRRSKKTNREEEEEYRHPLHERALSRDRESHHPSVPAPPVREPRSPPRRDAFRGRPIPIPPDMLPSPEDSLSLSFSLPDVGGQREMERLEGEVTEEKHRADSFAEGRGSESEWQKLRRGGGTRADPANLETRVRISSPSRGAVDRHRDSSSVSFAHGSAFKQAPDVAASSQVQREQEKERMAFESLIQESRRQQVLRDGGAGWGADSQIPQPSVVEGVDSDQRRRRGRDRDPLQWKDRPLPSSLEERGQVGVGGEERGRGREGISRRSPCRAPPSVPAVPVWGDSPPPPPTRSAEVGKIEAALRLAEEEEGSLRMMGNRGRHVHGQRLTSHDLLFPREEMEGEEEDLASLEGDIELMDPAVVIARIKARLGMAGGGTISPLHPHLHPSASRLPFTSPLLRTLQDPQSSLFPAHVSIRRTEPLSNTQPQAEGPAPASSFPSHAAASRQTVAVPPPPFVDPPFFPSGEDPSFFPPRRDFLGVGLEQNAGEEEDDYSFRRATAMSPQREFQVPEGQRDVLETPFSPSQGGDLHAERARRALASRGPAPPVPLRDPLARAPSPSPAQHANASSATPLPSPVVDSRSVLSGTAAGAERDGGPWGDYDKEVEHPFVRPQEGREGVRVPIPVPSLSPVSQIQVRPEPNREETETPSHSPAGRHTLSPPALRPSTVSPDHLPRAPAPTQHPTDTLPIRPPSPSPGSATTLNPIPHLPPQLEESRSAGGAGNDPRAELRSSDSESHQIPLREAPFHPPSPQADRPNSSVSPARIAEVRQLLFGGECVASPAGRLEVGADAELETEEVVGRSGEERVDAETVFLKRDAQVQVDEKRFFCRVSGGAEFDSALPLIVWQRRSAVDERLLRRVVDESESGGVEGPHRRGGGERRASQNDVTEAVAVGREDGAVEESRRESLLSLSYSLSASFVPDRDTGEQEAPEMAAPLGWMREDKRGLQDFHPVWGGNREAGGGRRGVCRNGDEENRQRVREAGMSTQKELLPSDKTRGVSVSPPWEVRCGEVAAYSPEGVSRIHSQREQQQGENEHETAFERQAAGTKRVDVPPQAVHFASASDLRSPSPQRGGRVGTHTQQAPQAHQPRAASAPPRGRSAGVAPLSPAPVLVVERRSLEEERGREDERRAHRGRGSRREWIRRGGGGTAVRFPSSHPPDQSLLQVPQPSVNRSRQLQRLVGTRSSTGWSDTPMVDHLDFPGSDYDNERGEGERPESAHRGRQSALSPQPALASQPGGRVGGLGGEEGVAMSGVAGRLSARVRRDVLEEEAEEREAAETLLIETSADRDGGRLEAMVAESYEHERSRAEARYFRLLAPLFAS
uniref:Uncharacterized protein n=1 Tax=Chromera velia CCMP2878 TaxID=1169474 RepID=A0A0G4HIQ2_9ALVE|eukprot:Cvel_27942.t1-p1 / transcript=Cvel_27942.t1 / gene=Cvel_27942 / organism=Chromera_velia_CCMP2878 / gene_product=Histone acetyltransferase p300, putative / transcript_product=Histone acetyltransferase p300, putative / location=Cvel_scaffold3563:7165-13372(+) / protein_length=1584 / sequence_SO=supercontig / SO=protein_coding / is_pseudo=false